MGNDNQLGTLIFGFITILIGIVLIGSLADNIYSAVTLTPNINETIAITSTNSTATENISISSSAGQTKNISVTNIAWFGNSDVNTTSVGIIIGEHINWSRNGVIIVDADNFSDDEYNITYYWDFNASGSTSEDDVTGVTYFGNGSLNTDDSGININTEVNWTTSGDITVATVNFTNDDYDISYTFEGDEYVTNSTARVLLPLVTLFFAIAVMLVGAAFVLKGFKGMGF